MTSQTSADPPATSGRNWRREFAATLVLAWPMALTQLGQVAMFTTDLAMLGRLGPDAVAAVSLAHTVFFSAFVVGMGLVSAVAPLAAQAYGARQPAIVRRVVGVGIWAAIGLGLPLTAAQVWSEDLLLALGQVPATSALAAEYLRGLAWCLIPAWVFMALRGFMGAVNRPGPPLWITLAAIPLNALLAFGLINGAFGLPRLEVLGAGLATTIVNVAMCAAALVIASLGAPFRRYRVIGALGRFDATLLRQLMAIGIPMSAAFMLEFGLFAVAALIMGSIGTVELAAHQIALQVASILFMVPFGISMAATVRVGHAVGARDASATRRAGIAALALGAAFMIAMMALVIALRHRIPDAFLGASEAGSAAPAALAASLLLIGTTFFVADALQTIAAGALRGLSDTRIPLVFAGVSFWALGFPAAWLLGLSYGYGAVGVWIGLSTGLITYAVLLVARFLILTRRLYLPPVVSAAEPK